jgi:Tfp pilus assembly protein PilO
MTRQESNHWKVDKRIPIALIITLGMQMIGAVIWATELDARVGVIERQRYDGAQLKEQFARLDERLDSVRQELDRMNHRLDKITERLIKK